MVYSLLVVCTVLSHIVSPLILKTVLCHITAVDILLIKDCRADLSTFCGQLVSNGAATSALVFGFLGRREVLPLGHTVSLVK